MSTLRKETLEQARPLGMSGEREAKHLSRIEQLERENRAMRSLLLHLHSARVGMNHEQVVAGLEAVDAYFRELNTN
jgi:hypothetical protein